MKFKKLLLVFVAVIAVFSYGTTGFCHQPDIKEKAELTFSGYLNIQYEYTSTDYKDNTNELSDEQTSDISVDELGLAFSAGLTKDVTADVFFLYEESENEDAVVTVEEAYLSLIPPTMDMFYLQAGKFTLPFGSTSEAGLSTYTHDLGETTESALAVGVNVSFIDIEVGVFNGDVDEYSDDNGDGINDNDNHTDDFYVSMLLTPVENDAMTLSMSAAYISDIADTDADLLRVSEYDPSADPNDPESVGVPGYTEKTGGYCAWFSAKAKTGSILIDYITAEDEMKDLNEAKPTALNIEVLGTFIEDVTIGLKYEKTEDFIELVEGGDKKITRMGALLGYELNEKAEISLEYLNAKDDLDNVVDTVTAQLALEF